MTIRIASAFKILSRRRRRGGYPAVPSSRRRAIGCSKPRFIDNGLPLSGGAAARPCPGHAGILISPRRELTGIGRSAKGKDHAGPDLPQPALQHLAQDTGLVTRQGRRARDRRISEHALHGGAAEDAARAVKDARPRAHSQKGGGRSRHRPGKAVGRPAHRGDGETPHHRRAADRRLRQQSRARPPARNGAGGAVEEGARWPGGGEGRDEVGDSRALARYAHLTLPSLARWAPPSPPFRAERVFGYSAAWACGASAEARNFSMTSQFV